MPHAKSLRKPGLLTQGQALSPHHLAVTDPGKPWGRLAVEWASPAHAKRAWRLQETCGHYWASAPENLKRGPLTSLATPPLPEAGVRRCPSLLPSTPSHAALLGQWSHRELPGWTAHHHLPGWSLWEEHTKTSGTQSQFHISPSHLYYAVSQERVGMLLTHLI